MVDIPENGSTSWSSRLRGRIARMGWGRIGLGRKFAFVLAVLTVLSVIVTYVALTDSAFALQRQTFLPLLLINLILLLALGALIARRLVSLWAARRSGLAGSGLHSRLVVLFSLVAIAPTIVMALFSVLFFQLGVEVWFSDRVHSVVDNSVKVAEAYTAEHRKVIRADIQAMAADLNRQAPLLVSNIQRLQQVVNGQALARALSEAVMFNSSGTVLAQANLTFSLGIDRLPTSVLREAANGLVVILDNNSEDRVSAVVRLDRYFDSYLYVSRFLDPQVVAYAENTRSTVADYRDLESNLGQKQTVFNMIYIVLAVLVLLAAVWTGLWLATRLVAPITRLIAAAGVIGEGDLSARVSEEEGPDELGVLSRAFNRMTGQLQSQQNELVEANNQLDIRRRFTETVLAGVTAGVIGLDHDGVVNLSNRSAARLLGRSEKALMGIRLGELVPEMAELVGKARARPAQVAQGQVDFLSRGRMTNLLVRVSTETFGRDIKGFVVTFDDITDLVAAQRTAAWADIARRIAHEIKNPLTPIQLAAERLKRKYHKDIQTDAKIFAQCTDTIVRQVGDIRRMVDEFSAFARMPAPVFEAQNMGELIRQVLFLQQVSAPDVETEFKAPDNPIVVRCDRRQVSQAMVNVIKNAIESIAARRAAADGNGAEPPPRGHIELTLSEDGDHAVIAVTDNGCGLPRQHKERLAEPYVTTREKGTGLGLAIVKKVMQDHGGELRLEDHPAGGARILLIFHHSPAIERDKRQHGPDGTTGKTGKAVKNGA